jgi:hypothetical protein
MKCSQLRNLLADKGPAALAGNREAEDHLVGCGACFAVLEALSEIDALVPELEQLDVSDETVEQLLQRSELSETSDDRPTAPSGWMAWLRQHLPTMVALWAWWQPTKWLGEVFDRARRARLRWGIVALPAVLLVGIVSVHTMRTLRRPSESGLASSKPYVVKQIKFKQSPGDQDGSAEREATLARGGGASVDGIEAGREEAPRAKISREIENRKRSEPAEIPAPVPKSFADQTEPNFVPDDNLVLGVPDAPAPPEPPVLAMIVPDDRDQRSADVEVTGEKIEQAMERSFEGDVTVTGSLIPRADLMALSPAVVSSEHGGRETDSERFKDAEEERPSQVVGDDKAKRQNGGERYRRIPSADARDVEHKRNLENYRNKLDDLEEQSEEIRRIGDKETADQLDEQLEVLKKRYEKAAGEPYIGGKNDDAADPASRSQSTAEEVSGIDDGSLSAARLFLMDRDRIDGLTFREARGYWANTYVPGDRTLRQLKARIDRSAGSGPVALLHEGARQISQPFDSPDGAALAVYLHADRPGAEARERMLVQVGLKATERRSGMRPAMNIGLVLDLGGEVTPETATSLRALLGAFASSTELGDRFSLTVAGRPGGTVIAPGDLRHGPLTVAMADLFGEASEGTVLSLEEAAAAARDIVRADDDPNAPLGSSALIVITSRKLVGLVDGLVEQAQASAVDGVPWSAIGVGPSVDLSDLDTLVLAGQGNRRLLTAAADAESLVDRELAAVSRVVARAVRLRIRLAPGVQLVDVIGSQRLDEDRAQRVRDAEQSIDRRLSRNLGIQTDRGLDEEGIQIVIPSYYADDAHVVLLDVVVPGPGPVADVSVRYKDLVHMRNGVARAHLDLARAGRTGAGPLELNVVANLVAVEVASRLDGAADALEIGELTAARAGLNECLDLVRGVAFLVDGLGQSPDLEADLSLLAGYLEALEDLSPGDRKQRQIITDSMRYAARLKILPPPTSDETD